MLLFLIVETSLVGSIRAESATSPDRFVPLVVGAPPFLFHVMAMLAPLSSVPFPYCDPQFAMAITRPPNRRYSRVGAAPLDAKLTVWLLDKVPVHGENV